MYGFFCQSSTQLCVAKIPRKYAGIAGVVPRTLLRYISVRDTCMFYCFTRHLVCLFLLGKPAQREGARTGLEVLCEVLHPNLFRPERPDHNTGNYMPYSLQVCLEGGVSIAPRLSINTCVFVISERE